jgi:hypothetical protein
MANGINHAKKILIDETLSNVTKLENGSAGDLHVIGRTLSKVARITCAMYENDFVTEQTCLSRHEAAKKSKKNTRLKIGPVEIEGPMTTALLVHSIPLACCCAVLFMVGKLQNWW